MCNSLGWKRECSILSSSVEATYIPRYVPIDMAAIFTLLGPRGQPRDGAIDFVQKLEPAGLDRRRSAGLPRVNRFFNVSI
jgi:hypothetical protein